MKAAIAQCPVLTEVDIQPRQNFFSQSRSVDREKVMGYVTKSVIVLACLAMTYVLISRGQIFQNYLQW
jgi:hypothetical protein